MLARRVSTREQVRLRNVVTDRREEQVVDAFGCDSRCTGSHIATSGPCELLQIGILQAPLEAAFRSLVQPVPETNCAFDNVANIAGAGASCPGSTRAGWRCFCRASGIVSENVSVTADPTRRSRISGNRRIGGLRTKRRDGWRVGNFYGLVARVLRSSGILVAEVGVNIDLRRGMPLQFDQGLFVANQRQSAIRSRRHVGQLRCTETADAIAANYFDTQVKFLGDQRQCGADAHAATSPRVVERAGSRWGRQNRSRGVYAPRRIDRRTLQNYRSAGVAGGGANH